MSDRSAASSSPADAPGGLSVLAWTGAAFLYWLAFMAVLEPGNVLGAIEAGGRIHWEREAIRLLGAGVLGAAVTPLLLAGVSRLPITASTWLRNGLLQAAGVVVLAPCLVIVSCLLAAWALLGVPFPSMEDVRAQLLANTLLLVFCLGLFVIVIQAGQRLMAERAVAAPPQRPWPQSITITDRGRLKVVDLAAVDWIETQGNYQALHAGAAVHLLRETSARLASSLDPARFVRVHRRAIVAVDRVRRMEPLSNGDAIAHLSTGAELRVSRRHRAALREHIAAGADLLAP